MFCRYCGTQIHDGSAFCKNCGEPVSKPEAPTLPQEESAPAEEPVIVPQHFEPPAPEETPAATFCRFCGTQNKAGNAFCRNCGKSLRKPSEEPAPVEPEVPTLPQEEPAPVEEPVIVPQHFDPPAPEEVPAVAFCRFCGTQNKAGNAFCRNCGKSLRKPSEEPAPVEPEIPTPAEEPVIVPQHFDPPTPEEAPAVAFCRFCGTQNKAGNAFCKNCGKSLRKPSEEPAPVEPEIPTLPQEEPAPTEEPVIALQHFDPPAPEETPAVAFCRFCGTQNKAGNAFCKNCGKPLSKPKVPADTPVEEPAPVEPEIPVLPQEEPAPAEEPVIVPQHFDPPAPEEAPAVAFCRFCGTQNKAGNAFCKNCGKPLSKQEVPSAEEPDFTAPAPTGPEIPTPPQEEPAPTEQTPAKGGKKAKDPKPPKEKKKSKVKWIILAVSLLLAAGLIVALVINFDAIRNLFSRSDGDERSESEDNGSGPDGGDPELQLPDDLQLSHFTSQTFDVYLDVEEEVIFTVEVSASEPLPPDVLAVYDEDGELIVYMNDDGVDGDAVANDSVYTGRARVSSREMRLTNYYAAAGGKKSESFEISFYRELTEEEFSAFANLLDTVSALSFGDASRYVQSSSEIQNYTIDPDGRIITYQSVYGPFGVWEEASANTKGNGEFALSSTLGVDYDAVGDLIPALAFTPAVVNRDVIVLRPFRGSEFLYDDFRSAGGALAEALGGTLTVLDNEEVTLDVMRTLFSYGTVLMDSHGAKIGNDPYVLIGEELNAARFLQDQAYYEQHRKYSADYVSGRLYCTGYHNRLAVGSKFFDKYYAAGSLDGSYWFLGACHTLCSDSVADVLTDRGAAAVIGFSDAVSVDYCNQTLFETTVNSLLLSADTAGSAVQCAKDLYGETDSQGGCELLLRGDGEFRLMREVTQKPGTLSGKVCKASDRLTPIPDAAIEVYRDGTSVTALRADRNGNYSVELPEGQYTVKISAESYISFNAYTSVTAGETAYMETFLMVEGSEEEIGTAGGVVINSLSGTGIEGVTLTFVRDWNNTDASAEVLATVVTGADGRYSVDLHLGNYTVIAEKEDHLSSSFNIIVQSGVTENQNGTITPIISGNSYLITLTWGRDPVDLDSHMEGTLLNGNRFHVNFAEPYQYDGSTKMCELDYDDTDSYGPEHITLNSTTESPYYYYVHRYDGNGYLSTSGAKVTVHQGNALIAEFNVPTDLGNEDYWNVFAIKDGKLIVGNTITRLPDTSYAD